MSGEGGVTLGGGECTAQIEGAISLLMACKKVLTQLLKLVGILRPINFATGTICWHIFIWH